MQEERTHAVIIAEIKVRTPGFYKTLPFPVNQQIIVFVFLPDPFGTLFPVLIANKYDYVT